MFYKCLSFLSALVGLCCGAGFSLVVSGGYSLVAAHELLISVTSLVSTGSRAPELQQLWHEGSVVAVPRL